MPPLLSEPPSGLRLKLEIWQPGGSFKIRAALWAMLSMKAHKRRVVAVSTGNHALAVAQAAQFLNVAATLFVTADTDPERLEVIAETGARIQLCDNLAAAYAAADSAASSECPLIHPFDGEHVAVGAGTLAIEMYEQAPDLEAIVVPVGGGGLLGALAHCYRQLDRSIAVYGVEPAGAPSISRSLASGRAERLPRTDTIADSLAAPMALPYSLALCRHARDVVLIDDDQLRTALRQLYRRCKWALEPAAAAAYAGATTVLAPLLAGRQTGVLLCGSNIRLDRAAAFQDAPPQ